MNMVKAESDFILLVQQNRILIMISKKKNLVKEGYEALKSELLLSAGGMNEVQGITTAHQN